nr:hypothetical protein [Tanacetum cinerariifolium]
MITLSIIYEYDGLPIQPVASPSPVYVPGPEHPLSPDYVPDLEHPPSPVEIPYVPELEYPEYLEPSDDEAPLEDQPLPSDTSPIAASPDYVADSDPEEDPEEDPEDDQADYPADGEDGDDEPFDDDDDDDTYNEDPKDEPFEDEEDDDEEEEHLALADPPAVPTLYASLDMLPYLHHHYLYHLHHYPCHHHLPLARLPLPSPLTTSPTDTGAPLGYKAVGIKMRALLPSTSRMTNILEADMLPQKRACLTTSALGFEIRESSTASAARQPGPTESDLRRCRTNEFEIRFEEAQDDQALLRARVNTLFRDRPDHCRTAMLMDREPMYARKAWASLRIGNQLTTALGCIEILEARDPEPQEGPAEDGNSWLSCMVIDVVMYGC